MEPIESKVYRLVPDHRYAEPLPGFRPSGLTVTTDRALALAREDIDFLTADHPLVTGAMDHFLGTGKGNAAFACLPDNAERRICLEMLFVVEAAAASAAMLPSFLPPTPLRVVVDPALDEDLGELFDPDSHRLEEGPAALWSRVLPAVSPAIPQMVETGRTLALDRAKPIIEGAWAAARQSMDETVKRLEALGRVNPAIADRDVAQARQARDAAAEAIASARVRLDALRLVVMGKPG